MSKLKPRKAIAMAVAVAAAAVVSNAASATDGDDGLNAFVSAYQCSLADLIARIHAHHNKPGEKGRFVVLALPGPTASYVQCAFDPRDREGLCEASSGWWNNSSEKPLFSSVQLAALARLGFSTDGSHGNFKKNLEIPPAGFEPYALAELMLSALYVGYSARKEMAIEVVAPFALEHGFLPQQRCVPIS